MADPDPSIVAIVDAEIRVDGLLAAMSVEDRLVVLIRSLAHQLCRYPPSERRETLNAVLLEIPEALDASEAAMRDVILQRIKAGR